jgi:hypothetical protein
MIAAMDEIRRRWRPRAWQMAAAAIVVLLLATWVALLAIRRHNEHVWAATVPALEAAGYACRIEGWAAELPPVDAPRQERLWLALKAMPEIREPPTFAAWLAGTAADPGPDTARLLADHQAAVDEIIALVSDGARADMSGWISADLAAGHRPPASRYSDLGAVLSVASWLRQAALVERSADRVADLDRWAAALGHGALLDAMLSITVADTVDRTRIACVERGIVDAEASRSWLEAPFPGRDLLRGAWRAERALSTSCYLDLGPSLLSADFGLEMTDPRAWWQWAVFPDGASDMARWYAAQEAAAAGGSVPALPRGIGGAGSVLVTITRPNLLEAVNAVSERCSAGRLHRLAARLIFVARRGGHVPADESEAAAAIAPIAFAAEAETCAVRYLAVGAGFRLELDPRKPPTALPPPRRVAAVEVVDALRAAAPVP